MKMSLKNMWIHFPFVIVAFATAFQMAVGNPGVRARPTETTTAGKGGKNLEGKMFTLSSNSGGVVFFPPHATLSATQPYPYTTSYYYTPTPSTTTAPAVNGVSVCFRYLTDSQSIQQFFKLGSDSSHSLYLSLQGQPDTYSVTFNNQYSAMSFQINKKFWMPNYDLWTSFCLTVDNRKKVAQAFSGSKMSIRKLMSGPLVWSGEPVIEFSSFYGQLTDVQVWDHPLSYSNVLSYMYRTYIWPMRGSVITWSAISYSVRGNALLEDSYDTGRKKVLQNKFLFDEKRPGFNNLPM